VIEPPELKFLDSAAKETLILALIERDNALTVEYAELKLSANDSTAHSHFLLDRWIPSGISERCGRFKLPDNYLSAKLRPRRRLSGL
jgi:hypothetical protein